MPRPTKREAEMTVETFYGINPTTFEIEMVSLTQGGMLRRYGNDESHYQHSLPAGQSAQTEIMLVWHLRELISLRPGVESEEARKRAVEELRAKAVQMKKENEDTLGG